MNLRSTCITHFSWIFFVIIIITKYCFFCCNIFLVCIELYRIAFKGTDREKRRGRQQRALDWSIYHRQFNGLKTWKWCINVDCELILSSYQHYSILAEKSIELTQKHFLGKPVSQHQQVQTPKNIHCAYLIIIIQDGLTSSVIHSAACCCSKWCCSKCCCSKAWFTTYIHNCNQRSIASSSGSLCIVPAFHMLIFFWELDSQSHMISCCHKILAWRILWVLHPAWVMVSFYLHPVIALMLDWAWSKTFQNAGYKEQNSQLVPTCLGASSLDRSTFFSMFCLELGLEETYEDSLHPC